jgi:hypothetical protein
MHAPFVCSSIQPYSPVAIEVLFYLVFIWGGASPPLCGGACHTLGAVRRLLLSKHTGGGGATPVFSGWLVYLQFMWGSTPPPSLVELSSRQPLYKLSPLQGCWRVLPLLPSLTCLFIYSLREGVPLPLSPELRVPHSLCYVSFFSSCLFIIQFFSLDWFLSVQWAMLICLREYCVPLICSPRGLLLSSRVGAGVWQCRSPRGFSI